MKKPHGVECSCAPCTDARMFETYDYRRPAAERWIATEKGLHRVRTTINRFGAKALGVGATKAEAIADLKTKIKGAKS